MIPRGDGWYTMIDSVLMCGLIWPVLGGHGNAGPTNEWEGNGRDDEEIIWDVRSVCVVLVCLLLRIF